MKLIILDRDGVINHDSDAYIKSADEWVAIPGSLEAITRLHQAGYRVVVATNQSGVGRGLFDIDTLNDIHAKMHRELSRLGGMIEAVFFCPHTPEDNCSCRKPKAGLLKAIGERLGTDLAGVACVGDSLRDVQACQAVGAEPMLVRTGKGERTLEAGIGLENVAVFDDLAAVAAHLIGAGS